LEVNHHENRYKQFLAAAFTLGLLASCAQTSALEVRNEDTRGDAQNTPAFADHDGIARRYEDTAKALLVKAEERKKLLQHYEDKSYLYGRRGQDFQSHAVALERKYKLEAEKAANRAAFHRRIALEIAKPRNYASGGNSTRELGTR
jgi:hypothetical protein